MKAVLLLSSVLLTTGFFGSGPKREPGESVTFTFKRLPETLWSMGMPEASKQPPAATVWFPEDYTTDRRFPLVVFMGGARGESGHSAHKTVNLVGKTGVICVSLPLFKNPEDLQAHRASEHIHPLYIDPGQAELLWSAHGPMLKKIFAEIPNIDRNLCFMGGFSNGAHATAVQLNHPEVGLELRKYFDTFYFVEGGSVLKPTHALADTTLLFLQGESRKDWLARTAKPFGWNARIHTEVRTMLGAGHAFPVAEKTWVGNWIRARCGLDPLP